MLRKSCCQSGQISGMTAETSTDIDRFSDLKDMMVTKNGDTIVTFGDGDRLVIENVAVADLAANDFLL